MLKHINLEDRLGGREYKGEIEFIIKDLRGRVIDRHIEPNIVKVFAKEILSHRLGASQVWDPGANNGVGAWIPSPIDPNEDFAAKYILFGASYDSSGVPLDVNDPRYYNIDPVTQTPIPVRLTPGAEYGGGLINAIPLAEPNRPLKRIENVSFEATYQPVGTPQLSPDVRAMNSIVLFETTLRNTEYNGFGLTPSDFFTITEVALAAGKQLGPIGACELDPKDLFIEGNDDRTPLLAIASGTDTISLDPTVTNVDLIKTGDQVKLTSYPAGSGFGSVGGGSSGPGGNDSLDQVSPYYLVINKNPGGRDITLDRVPTNAAQTPITGNIGVYRDTLRIFSHRVLDSPVKKFSQVEIICRWRIIFN
jgi:hypothetical protein